MYCSSNVVLPVPRAPRIPIRRASQLIWLYRYLLCVRSTSRTWRIDSDCSCLNWLSCNIAVALLMKHAAKIQLLFRKSKFFATFLLSESDLSVFCHFCKSKLPTFYGNPTYQCPFLPCFPCRSSTIFALYVSCALLYLFDYFT